MALQPISIDELRRRNEQSQAARDAEKASNSTPKKG